MTERVDCVVIGAGVVGLAVARSLALAGREVLILEAEAGIGGGISSRNSEVIHAGMYYPTGSLKARLCVEGNKLLRAFASERGVTFRMTGKLIVAANSDEEPGLRAILDRAHANGVNSLTLISAAEARDMEPELQCTLALWSPDTGIVDSHGLMLAILAEAEAHHAQLVTHAPVVGGRAHEGGIDVQVGGADPITVTARTVIIAGGLESPSLGRLFDLANVPRAHLCKGNYFTLTGRMPFSRLVYPMPDSAGLGVHYTLDLDGRGRFGPDVEWIDAVDFSVDPRRADGFRMSIARYWPGIEGRALDAAYSGIRPKIVGPGEPAADFLIHGPKDHGVPGVVALYGIESPGLTSSLALARQVTDLAA